MHGQVAISIAAAWAILLAPTLCLGGVLVHDCDCTATEACSHETDCAEDPCAAAPTQRSHGMTAPNDLAPVAASSETTIIDERLTAANRQPSALWLAPPIRPARYSDSGLPLLN